MEKITLKAFFTFYLLLSFSGINILICQNTTTIDFNNYHEIRGYNDARIYGDFSSAVTLVDLSHKYKIYYGQVNLYPDFHKNLSGNLQIQLTEPVSGAYIRNIIIDYSVTSANVHLWFNISSYGMLLYRHGFSTNTSNNKIYINPTALTGNVWMGPNYTINLTPYIPLALGMSYAYWPNRLYFTIYKLTIIWGIR